MSSFYCFASQLGAGRFRPALGPCADDAELPFAQSLSAEEVERAFREEGVAFGAQERAVYTPQVTLWAWLSQVLSHGVDRSCRAAVHRLIVLCLLCGWRAPSPDTGAYCRARAKVTVGVLRRLTEGVAEAVENDMPEAWRWRGRRVLLADGTTALLPDTPANQRAYPQARTQRPGVGFPILRMVVLLSLATGMLCGMAEGPYKGKKTGEPALLRELLDRFRADDVLVADCCYCSYLMIALLLARGVDVVMKLHQRREFDFAQGRPLGPGDALVTWQKPARPDWMDEKTYQGLPAELTLRLVEIQVHVKGFRVQEYVLTTTLTDPEAYPVESLGELYFWRWHAELDLRQIKCAMHLDDLRCKTPAMVRRELWAHWLGYNLVRRRMAQAALGGQVGALAGLGGAWGETVWRRLGPQGRAAPATAQQPRGDSPVRYLSFAAALHITQATWLVGSLARGPTRRLLTQACLLVIASSRLPDRPFRVEPRAIKRRPKPHKLLKKPRPEARAELISGDDQAA